MLEFLSLLRQRYHVVLNSNPHDAHHYQQTYEQLTLAQAFFRKGKMSAMLPLQIAVIGPTQAGKSSIVNVFLQSQNAGVSPLAGYTVHPQGFCHAIDLATCDDLENYFAPFSKTLPEQLDNNRYDCYSLTKSKTISSCLPPSVLWDTPDFDSIDSVDYREGVLKTIALADAIILVFFKEIYADQAGWDMIKRI